MIKTANKLADIAAEIAKFYFRKDLSISFKEGESHFTRADLEIETAIREYLNTIYPSHGIYGEEYELKRSNSEYVWVIDPIDGTSAFSLWKTNILHTYRST